MRRATWEGASAGCVVVSGNHLPNPLPPRVRPHSSIARPAHGACDVFRSMPETGPPWQCRLASTQTYGPPPRPLAVPGRAARNGSARAVRGRHPGGAEPTLPGEPAGSPAPSGTHRAVCSGGGWESGIRMPARTGRRPGPPNPPPGPPARRGGAQRWPGAPGCAPVERLISAHATVHFQPTSGTGPFLVEMADQPPCHQAGRDRSVRFRPMGTGHERRTHFPARARSETLRDRTLPARLPCRQ